MSSLTSCLNSPLPGNQPPAMVPRKGQYIFKEIPLLKQFFQVPLNIPKDFFGETVKKGEEEDEEKTRQLRAPAALPEDLI